MLTLSLGTVGGPGAVEFGAQLEVQHVFGNEIGASADEVRVSIRFPSVCTSFNHDGGDVTFTGSVALTRYQHFACYVGSSFVFTFTNEFLDSSASPLGPIVLDATGTFDALAGTGSAHATQTEHETLFFRPDGATAISYVDTCVYTIDLEGLSPLGSTAVSGTISGGVSLPQVPLAVTFEPRPVLLEIGAICL